MDVRATCFLWTHSHQRTEDWNYNNSQERVHYITRVQPCTQLNISHAVTNFLGCCLWVGMDLRALWSTEEKFGVEILFWVGRQAKRRLVLEKRSLIWWHSLICFECTVVASQVLLHSDPKVSGPLFTSVKRYFLKKILTVKSHHLFVNIKSPLHNQCLLLLTKAASVCWACF